MPDVLTGEAAALHDYVNDEDRTIVAHLAQNVIPLELAAVTAATFVEAAFPGYEAVELDTFIDADQESEDYGKVFTDFFIFQADAIVGAFPVTAVYITVQEGEEAPVLLQCEIFNQPLQFTGEGQFLKRRLVIESFEPPEE
jgi:hypothetical protein